MKNIVLNATVGLAALLAASVATTIPAMAQKVFPTAQAAADDLVAAAKAGRQGFVTELFGPRGRQLVSTGNAEQDKERLAEFVAAASTKFKLEDKDANTKLLIIGEREFPFPIPIIKKGEGWAFDPVAGQREIRSRLIGHNELAAISACSAYMAAQKDYIKSDRDNDRVLEYAQRVISSPGKQDGLYWEPQSQSDVSPLEGALSDAVRSARAGAQSYEGYMFRILKAQGPAAPGGAYNYVINGNMIGGHALFAYPVKWGETGVMSFMCSHHGDVYEKDLGAGTATAASRVTSYNPDRTWRLVD
ncbi:MAG: DUF2950 domain-containing protein [Beijerinckiaceae bacterium]|nr:DUF2950 domain-containing protein [Beijerinckiaceae bacterium]